MKGSIEQHIETLSTEINQISDLITEIVDSDKELKRRKEILKAIPGIGDVIAHALLVLLPELGQLSGKEIASLCGVAPMANDSGTRNGRRITGHGRNGVKNTLFLAAMSARNSNSELRAFYEALTARGKLKMIALVAVMRKIIVIANARIRDEKADLSLTA